jgi:hypothetical protein
MKPKPRTTRTPPQACPACGYLLDATTDFAGRARPRYRRAVRARRGPEGPGAHPCPAPPEGSPRTDST